MKVGFAITASFCTLKEAIKSILILKDAGYDVYPIVSENIVKYDTRFGKARDIVQEIEKITGHSVAKNIVDAEKFGPLNPMDVMVVLPATGDFLGKMAGGITDNPVNLAVKATLRNKKPIVIAISTNDGLGLSGENIIKLYNTKNIYFVPFGQDNYKDKPNSLIAHYDMLIPTIEKALNDTQIQPVIKEYKKSV